MTLYYPDLSNNNWRSGQDLISFLAEMPKEGFAGVCHKVSEGNYYLDAYWPICLNWCRQNNMPVIGYHYVTESDPNGQAQAYLNNGGTTNVMLDYEANSGGIENFWSVVDAFNRVGLNVQILYLPQWYWSGTMGSPDLSPLNGNGISLVSSNYPAGTGFASSIYEDAGGDSGPGWAGYGGVYPAAWQFTDKATVCGIPVDCNAYRGDDINVLFGTVAAAPPPPPPPPDTIAGLPTDDSVWTLMGSIPAIFGFDKGDD